MKLIVHIGSPKTASTSIQRFCALNRGVLRTEGFFYPPTPNGKPVFHFLAHALAKGPKDHAERFLNEANIQAQKENCHSVIISAESFFGLLPFSMKLLLLEHVDDEYWKQQESFVGDFKEVCSAYESVEIICYLRAQDEFVSSLYHQNIKQGVRISEDFEDFAYARRDAFDYERRINVWASVFGRNHIHLKNFGAVKSDIIQDFCLSFMNRHCFENAERTRLRFNTTRLSRDVMEAKRRFNLSCSDRPLAFIAARHFKRISSCFDDGPDDPVYADARFMETFFNAYKEGNDVLSMQYGMPELRPYTPKENVTLYAGLSDERAAEIDKLLHAHLRTPQARIELVMRRIWWFAGRHLPGANTLLGPLRRAYHKTRMQRKARK